MRAFISLWSLRLGPIVGGLSVLALILSGHWVAWCTLVGSTVLGFFGLHTTLIGWRGEEAREALIWRLM